MKFTKKDKKELVGEFKEMLIGGFISIVAVIFLAQLVKIMSKDISLLQSIFVVQWASLSSLIFVFWMIYFKLLKLESKINKSGR